MSYSVLANSQDMNGSQPQSAPAPPTRFRSTSSAAKRQPAPPPTCISRSKVPTPTERPGSHGLQSLPPMLQESTQQGAKNSPMNSQSKASAPPQRREVYRTQSSEGPGLRHRPAAVHQPKRSKPLSLPDFERKYSDQLPLQIEVWQGHRGDTPELCLSTGDVYNVHFKKYLDVVTIRDVKGHIFSIPIGSEIKFGLLYTPTRAAGEDTVATFKKVSDILLQRTLPRVVCAGAHWSTGNPKVSIEEGEILVVKKRGKSALIVFSLTTKSAKHLPGNCQGWFTTDPSLIGMYLLEIIEHVPNPFPCKAKIVVEGGSSEMEDITRRLRSRMVSILGRKREASLVATSVTEDDRYSTEAPTLLDIPLDNSLSEVEVVVINESTRHHHEKTRTLLKNFDARKLTSFRDMGSHETQSLFYERVRGDYVNVGVELEKPRALYAVDDTAASPSGSDNSESTDYENVEFPESSSVPSPSFSGHSPSSSSAARTPEAVLVPRWQGSEKRAEPSKSYSHQDNPAVPLIAVSYQQSSVPHFSSSAPSKSRPDGERARLDLLGKSSPQSPEEYVNFEPPTSVHGQSSHSDSQLERLHSEIQELKSAITMMTTATERPEVAKEEDETTRKNKQYLAGLSVDQVLKLLEAMAISQYQTAFAEFMVSGDILVDLDDSILDTELGITSKIHRIRLMRIISGRKSAKDLLEN